MKTKLSIILIALSTIACSRSSFKPTFRSVSPAASKLPETKVSFKALITADIQKSDLSNAIDEIILNISGDDGYSNVIEIGKNTSGEFSTSVDLLPFVVYTVNATAFDLLETSIGVGFTTINQNNSTDRSVNIVIHMKNEANPNITNGPIAASSMPTTVVTSGASTDLSIDINSDAYPVEIEISSTSPACTLGKQQITVPDPSPALLATVTVSPIVNSEGPCNVQGIASGSNGDLSEIVISHNVFTEFSTTITFSSNMFPELDRHYVENTSNNSDLFDAFKLNLTFSDSEGHNFTLPCVDKNNDFMPNCQDEFYFTAPMELEAKIDLIQSDIDPTEFYLHIDKSIRTSEFVISLFFYVEDAFGAFNWATFNFTSAAHPE